jgi:hypothetical protein
VAALLAPAGGAQAAGTITIAPAGALVEDVSGGLATTFRVDEEGLYDLEWHVHDDLQSGCAATPAADIGRRVRSRTLEPLKASGDTWTIYTMFPDTGRYLVCAWATPSGGGDPIAGQALVTVGEPRETLSLVAPKKVAVGRTFELRAIAASQAWRMAFVTVNAADVPCASSYSTNRALAAPVVGLVRSTFSRGGSARLSRPGVYRVCGWLQEHSRDPAPELRVQRLIRVVGGRGVRRQARGFDSR